MAIAHVVHRILAGTTGRVRRVWSHARERWSGLGRAVVAGAVGVAIPVTTATGAPARPVLPDVGDPPAATASTATSATPAAVSAGIVRAGTVDLGARSGTADGPGRQIRVRAGWAWPLAPPVSVVRVFDPPLERWSAGHRGVDLAAAVGSLVRSPTAGVVTFTGRVAGREVLVVTHHGGLRSTFEPVQDAVPVGTSVAAGEPIATVSAVPGHCAPVTCLHWGVLRRDVYLDPLAVIGRVRVVLLPLDAA